MKFSWKILFCTMLIMAAACGASGYFFVNYVFQTSMERETSQALDESSILRFAFETAALNIPSNYVLIPDGTVNRSEYTWRIVDSTATDCCGSVMRTVRCCIPAKGLPGILLCGKSTEKIREYTGYCSLGIPIISRHRPGSMCPTECLR